MEKTLLEIKDNDQLLSSCVVFCVELRSRKVAFIEEVKTTEGYRNKGYGKLIVQYAVAKAKEWKCDTVELCYNPRDALAGKLYESCGFEDDGNIRAKIVLNKKLKKVGKW